MVRSSACSSLATAMGNADAVISAIGYGGGGDASGYKAVDNEVRVLSTVHSKVLGSMWPCTSPLAVSPGLPCNTVISSSLPFAGAAHLLPCTLSRAGGAGEQEACGCGPEEEGQQVCAHELPADQRQGGRAVPESRHASHSEPTAGCLYQSLSVALLYFAVR